jgi:hypothetical protein
MQNEIYIGLDNPVVMTFSFTGEFGSGGLSNFTYIQLTIDSEVYTTSGTPNQLFLNGNNELRLKIGDTTSLPAGSYLPEIIGFSATYNDGYLLNGACKKVLSDKIKIKVC